VEGVTGGIFGGIGVIGSGTVEGIGVGVKGAGFGEVLGVGLTGEGGIEGGGGGEG
jgi:hypothetical protein